MSKQSLLSKLLLLAALILGTGGKAVAAEVANVVATFESSTVVTSSGYMEYQNDDWYVLMGGNNNSIGYNKNNVKKLDNSFGTDASTSDNGTYVRSKNKLSGVNRITFKYTGGSGDGGKLYLASSVDGTSWTAITLHTGEGLSAQGVKPVKSTDFTFEFDTINEAYYAFILDNGTTTGVYRFDYVTVNFVSVTSLELSSIALSGDYPTEFHTGDTFSHEGMTVTATYSDGSEADVTSAATFTGYDMSAAGTQEVTVSYTESGITQAATYNITVLERPAYTVTLSDGGSLTEESGGAGVTLPTRADMSGYTFAGWSLADITVGTTDASAIIAAGTYHPSDNVMLYPVYAYTDNGTAYEWQEVTEAPVDGDYAICSADYFMKASVVSNRFANGDATPAIENGKLTVAPADNCIWNIYKSSDNYYRIKNGTSFAAGNGTKNQGKLETSETSDYAKWTISYDDGFVIENVGNSSKNVNKTLRNNGSYGWAAYADNTGSAPRLFKHTAIEVSTTYYTSHPVTTATITLNAACTDGEMVYGTYSNSRPFVVSDDIVVAEVGLVGGEMAIYTYDTGDVVPANTGVLVSAIEGGNYEVTLSTATGTSLLGDENQLRPTGDDGITAEQMAAADANSLYYRLTMHNTTQIGFWWGAAGGDAFALSANKAYLVAPQGQQARSGFTFASGDATAIQQATTASHRQYDTYNLQGQRVAVGAGPVPARLKGLYIVDGRKVVMK